MNVRVKATMNALIAQSGNAEQLYRFLPNDVAEEIQSYSKPESTDWSSIFSLAKWRDKIHYSWFSLIIKDLPQEVHPLFLGLLTPVQAENVSKMLPVSIVPKKVSYFLFPFLMNILKEQLQEEDLLNEQHLPSSPLNFLLKLSRKQLIHTIDLLGIHDLAADVRQIVDKELLGKVYKVLSQEQLHFLQKSVKQPIKWISPKLGLQSWNGNAKELNHLLHHRGLLRLARAIAQQHPSFKWYLLHRLDIGRANIIQKQLQQKQDFALTHFFTNQLLHIIKRYEKLL